MKPSALLVGCFVIGIIFTDIPITDTACESTHYHLETTGISEMAPDPAMALRGAVFLPDCEENRRKYFSVTSGSEAAIILSPTTTASSASGYYLIELSTGGKMELYKSSADLIAESAAANLLPGTDVELYVELSTDDTIHVGRRDGGRILSWKDDAGLLDINYILVQNYNDDGGIAEWTFCDGEVKLLSTNYDGDTSDTDTSTSGVEDLTSPCEEDGACVKENAIDGVLTDSEDFCTLLEQDAAGGDDGVSGWWRIDLGTMYDIKAVLILNGDDAGGSLSDLEGAVVRVGSCDSATQNQECGTAISSAEASDTDRPWILRECDNNYYGQYVYIYKQDDTIDLSHFGLCEVEIWGKAIPDDKKPRIGFSQKSVSEQEKSTENTNFDVTVQVSGGSADHPTCLEYKIDRATSGVTPAATLNTDFGDDSTNFISDSEPITLDFDAGDSNNPRTTEFTDAVTYLGDDDITVEEDEKFGYVISPMTPGLLVGDADSWPYGQITFTIENDDVAYCWEDITLEVLEDDNVYVTAVLKRTGYTARSSTAVVNTVTGASPGDASAGDDFTALSDYNVEFGEGDTEENVNVMILDNDCVETDEIFTIVFDTTKSDGEICEDEDSADLNIVTVTILNDDAQFQFKDNGDTDGNARQYEVSETDETVEVVVERTGYINEEVTIGVRTQPWTNPAEAASPGDDYIEISNEILTIPAGLTTASVTVTVVNDKEVEPQNGASTQEVFRLALVKNPTSLDDCVLGTVQTADIHIVDDDCTWSMLHTERVILEDEGPLSATVECKRENCVFGCREMADRSFTATVSVDSSGVSEGTSATDTDFISNTAVTVVAPSSTTGETSTTVSVNILNDILKEESEIFEITLTDSDGEIDTKETTSVTILDDDVLVSLNCEVENVVEEDVGKVTFTLERVGNLSESDSVLLFTNPGTASDGKDYTGVNVVATFNALETIITEEVLITDDTERETDEEFTIRIRPQSDQTDVDPNNNVCVWTIKDNDCSFSISATDDNREVTEGSTSSVSVTIRRTGSLKNTASIVLSTSTLNGGDEHDATPGEDFVDISTTVTFQPDDDTEVVTIEILDDEDIERTEYFLVALEGGDCSASGDNQIVIRINDDDESVVRMSASKITVDEGNDNGVATLSIVRTGSLSQPETVNLQVREVQGSSSEATAGSDFDDRDVTVEFEVGEDAVSADIAIFDDTKEEGLENFVVEISSLSGASAATIDNDNRETFVCIRDNDGTFRIGGDALERSVSEGTSVTVTVLRSGDTSTEQTVYLTTADLEASGNIDYQSLNGVPVTFSPEAISRSVTINTYDDQELEPRESFSVTLTSNNGNDLGQRTLLINIEDEDNEIRFTSSPGSTIIDSSLTVSESVGFVYLRIERSGFGNALPAGYATVNIASRELSSSGIPQAEATPAEKDGTGRDFEFTDATVTFQSGQARAEVEIQIIDDEEGESQEAFEVYLSNAQPSADNKIVYPNTIIIYVNDDDGGLTDGGDPGNGGDGGGDGGQGGDGSTSLSTPLIVGIGGGAGLLVLIVVLVVIALFAFSQLGNSAPAAAAAAPRVVTTRGQPPRPPQQRRPYYY